MGERVDVCADDFHATTRKLLKTTKRVKRIDPKTLTDPVQRARREHLEKFTARSYMEMTNAAKALKPAPPAPVTALPRRA